MIKLLKKTLSFLFKNLIFALFSICFFWILYILFVGYAPWSEKIVHLIIAIVVFIGLGKLFTWLDEK